MKSFAAFSALIASTLAQDFFGVMSARSSSPIHLQELTATGGKFFLGGKPSSYCPPQVGEDVCEKYPGNYTVLTGGRGGLSLGVIVPGGQRVYIAPDGTMSYTVPHSAYIPPGSVVDGWSRSENTGNSFGHLHFEGSLFGCPVGENKPWQVYAAIANVTLDSKCLGFSALTINTTEPGAWEY